MDILFLAIRYGQIDLVTKLIKILDINYCHPIYSYPLFYAVRFSSFQVIYTLISNGAKITIKDKNGNGILHYTNKPEIANLFSIHPDEQNHIGNTPLHQMVLCGNEKMVKYLLQKNASIKKNKEGKTPVHLAIENEEEKMIEYFLDYHHLDWNEPEQNGNTPLHLAILTKNKNIVKKIKHHCHVLSKNHHGKTAMELILDLKLDSNLIDIICHLIDYFEFHEERLQKILLDICFLFFYKEGSESHWIQKLSSIPVYSFIREKYFEESKQNKNVSY